MRRLSKRRTCVGDGPGLGPKRGVSGLGGPEDCGIQGFKLSRVTFEDGWPVLLLDFRLL